MDFRPNPIETKMNLHEAICLQNNSSCIKRQTSQMDQLDTSWIDNLDKPAIYQLNLLFVYSEIDLWICKLRVRKNALTGKILGQEVGATTDEEQPDQLPNEGLT